MSELGSVALCWRRIPGYLGDVGCYTAIMEHCWVDIQSLVDVWFPGAPVVSIFFHRGYCSKRIHRGAVLIKGSIQICII